MVYKISYILYKCHTFFDMRYLLPQYEIYVSHIRSESESELFTGDTSKDNHSPGPVFREVSP